MPRGGYPLGPGVGRVTRSPYPTGGGKVLGARPAAQRVTRKSNTLGAPVNTAATSAPGTTPSGGGTVPNTTRYRKTPSST